MVRKVCVTGPGSKWKQFTELILPGYFQHQSALQC